MEEMFRYPLSDVDAITNRSEAIGYYMRSGEVFPFRGAIFDAIEFYLGNTDTRSQLAQENNTLGRKVKSIVGSDTDFVWIHNGIVGCLELLNTLEDFLHKATGNDNKDIADSTSNLRALLANEKWQWYKNEKGKKKVSYEQAVTYDRVFRFEERDNLKKILYYVYLLDVYMTVAEVSKSRNFVQAKAYPTEVNILKLKGVFHPFLKKPVGNDIVVDKDSNVIFLTGANMAGKSTYLRTVGVNYLLACVGAPVCAESLRVFPAALVTSLRTSDSLVSHEAYFFAELKRLKMIIDRLQRGEQLFIILDEILKGTNSEDKQKGSLALMKQLVRYRSCGIIATHDLVLGTLADEFPGAIENYRFEADIVDDELRFSYRLQPGVARNMNACFLMQKMGITI